MINSISVKLNKIEIPHFDGEISMLPFDLCDTSTLPDNFHNTVNDMVNNLPILYGEAFFTIHGKFVSKDRTMRRGAPHIDGNYINGPSIKGYKRQLSGWSNPNPNPGWSTPNPNPGWENSNPNHNPGWSSHQPLVNGHKISYESATGGMLISSNYSACKGWNGVFDGIPNIGGDCSHIKLDDGFMLEANEVYYGNSQFIHESLPSDKDIHRVMIRITLPIEYPALVF